MIEKPKHDHQFTQRVAIPDRPHTKAEAIAARNYDKGPRWLLARKCTCGAKEFYGHTYQLPTKKKEGLTSSQATEQAG